MNDTDINPIRRTPVQASLFQSLGQPPPPCPPPPPLGGGQVTPTTQAFARALRLDGVRFLPKDGPDGPTFDVVAKDVVEHVGAKWDGHAIEHVPPKWKGRDRIPTPGGVQEVTTLSEEGLFFYLARSDKPAAMPFQMKVAGEILPSIRKTGGYGTPDLSDPVQALAILTQSLQLNQEYRARLEVADARLVMVDARLAVVEPKAANHDGLSGAGGGIGVYKSARILRYPPKTFTEWLEIAGYLFRRGRVLEPYADKIAKGLLFLKVDRAKNGYMYTQPMITARGLQHFKDLQLTGKIPIPENKF